MMLALLLALSHAPAADHAAPFALCGPTPAVRQAVRPAQPPRAVCARIRYGLS